MNQRRSRGVALITALLVVAVAVLTATALLTSANLAIRRTAALRDTEQAWMLSRGIQSWIMEIIKQDDPAYDALDEDNAWSRPVDYLPVDQGFLRGRVVDQQGLFNLNNLDRRLVPAQGQSIDDVYRHQFERLLDELLRKAKLQVPVQDLVPAIRDWMDAGQIPTFPGVEDQGYLGLDPPYRTADQPFVAVSELRAVQGVTAELYALLVAGCPLADDAPAQPCVAALPLTQAPGQPLAATKVNVNTASRVLLLSLSATTDVSALDSFLADRVDNPATSNPDFQARGVYPNPLPQEKIPDQVSVQTSYFQIRGEVVVGSSRLPLYSLIGRQPLRVIAHSAAED